ncbi:MAG TPA: hypothetical protein VNK49_10210 [Anaerolineales bacterium]|nr:hypothetical protein [Anaerolineales bacterium]
MSINIRKTPILISIALFVLFLMGMAWIQFATPDMPDNDGFYHIKLAYLMRTQSLKPDFIWLPLTILNANEFYDHHFLFHLALIPFTFGDLRVGAKWAAVLFAALAFLMIWFLFHRQRVPFAPVWALGMLGISDAFLYRMSITRAQSLSLALLALGFLWLLERKHKHLALLAFVYVWMYDAFPLLLALAVLYVIAIAITERRLDYRPILFVSAGIALGLVINPYFPNNIVFSFRHMLPKLTDATSISVGNEWYPYETAQLLDNSLPSLIAFASGALALGLSGRKMDARTAFAFLASLLFGYMLFQARRFVEYFPPFALIFAAFAWSPLLSDPQPAPSTPAFSSPRRFLQNNLPAFVLILALLASTFRTLPAARARMDDLKPYDLYAGAAHWLAQNTPQGTLVFQTDWDDFPRLFFYNTHNVYLIGLDPTYMQLYDPELYDLWVLITRGEVKQPSQFIANIFQARYVHTDLNHTRFLKQAENDPYLIEVYRDDQNVVFQVTR